jgi:putative redox protein
MVRISIDYQGDLHCAVRHEPSGTSFETDAPRDNQGRGESFSPTDLVATALGSCMATTMAIVCRRVGVELAGFHVTVDKEMTSEGPRRISRLTVHVHFPFARTDEIGPLLEKTAVTCPVYLSISDVMEKAVEFHWKAE